MLECDRIDISEEIELLEWNGFIHFFLAAFSPFRVSFQRSSRTLLS